MSTIEIISIIAIVIGVVQAIYITADVIYRPQTMGIMNVVWPITGLYFPIIGLITYVKIGRQDGMPRSHQEHHHDHQHSHSEKPFWQSVLMSTTHCSSGCALGDLIGAPIVFFLGWTIAGATIYPEFIVQFILAFSLGIIFQYYGMGMNKSGENHLSDAFKADTLSLIAFEIGMFGYMLIAHFVFFGGNLHADMPAFWFMMQIAMIIGFITSYPANWFLVKKGIKHAM